MLQQLIDGVNGFLWTYVVIGGLLGLGVYFTFRTNFVQFRYLKEIIRVLFDPPKDGQKVKSISSFKSFCIWSCDSNWNR